MAFIRSGSTIISFAEYQDVFDTDQRLFDENEGLSDEVVEDALIRATERILSNIKNTHWYREYALSQGASMLTIPNVDPAKIVSRQNDFTDLAVYYAMHEYILPRIADFGSEDNAERVKIGFYREKYSELFGELITMGDWYDYDADGVIRADELRPGVVNYQRIR
jgi:hypothetical protein